MDSPELITNINHSVANIELNRPDVGNALNINLIDSISNEIKRLSELPNIRIILFSGKGKHFCAGADLNWMKNSVNLSSEENYKEALKLAELFLLIFQSEKITISDIRGACIGGGIGLAAACDFIVADEAAFFSFSELKLGLIPSTIAPYIMHRIGSHQSKSLMLSGERFDAERGYALGLVDYISRKGEDQLNLLITQLKENGHQAVIELKKLFSKLSERDKSWSEINRFTSELIADIRTSKEACEGMNAFLEKRIPNWQIK